MLKMMFFIILINSVVFAEIITISAVESKPWSSKKLKKNGVGIDMVTQIFKSQGQNIKVKIYPWKRTVMMATLGRVDASVFYFKTKEREKVFNFSEEIFSVKEVLIYKKGKNIVFNSLDDLKNYKVGIVDGYTHGKVLDAMIKNKLIKTKVINSDLIGLNLLMKRKAFDVLLCDNDIARTLLAENYTPLEISQLVFHKNQ